jgi:photosystem II stability/assembly factor-like uncharacterized protein
MTKRLLCLLSLVCVAAVSMAQQLPTERLKNMKARSIGPGVMSGRITTIDAVWSNPDIIYVGAASGGVWKTENGGTSWTPIFDDQPILNIGSIAIQQSNPSVVWVGTGEGNPRNSINIGGGIYKSLDGGKTWKSMGLEKTRNIHRILIDPTNPNVVYAGVIGNPFSDHPERGVFKTTDGGQTWEKILYTNDKSGVGEMVMDPKNPNKILVNMWEHRRTPWNFVSGGAGSGLYLTFDGGKTWKKLGKTEGLPDGNIGRCGLAIARNEPNRMYAMVEATKNGLYRSDDGGLSWTKVTEDARIVTNRPFYFNEIYVDPKNENRIYSLLQTVDVSEDGGKSFRTAASFSQAHADHHALWIHPEDPSYIINGNDGGITISRDGGKRWIFSETLPLGQFYHINVDNDIPYHVYGGLQDNGSWQGPAYTWKSGGLYNHYWQGLNGGDGFDVSPDPEDSRYGYAMSQGGFLTRYDTKTGANVIIRPSHPDPKMRLRFNWNAALAQDPLDAKTIYYGSQFLHKSSDKGMTWEVISPDLTLDNKETQKLSDETGGLSLDITSAENHNTILAIAPSPKEKGLIWVSTDDGNVQLTRDGGKTWTNLSAKIGLPKEAWVPQVRASQHSAAEAFVVMNHYRMGDFAPYIYRTRDYGQTWERIVDDTKVKGYALCVIQDPVVPNLLFCGTEHGLWVSINDGKSWTQWKAGFPSVSTMDLAIQEREADLVIATFGRALYVLDDIRPLREVAQAGVAAFDKLLNVFDTPDAYLARIGTPPGEKNGDDIYEGENRSTGARLTYYVRVPHKEPVVAVAPPPAPVPAKKGSKNTPAPTAPTAAPADTAKKAAPARTDSVFIRIYSENGQLVRTLRQMPDSSGVYRTVWNLQEQNPQRMPGVPRPRRGAEGEGGGGGRGFGGGGGGAEALPGRYKVVLSYGKAKDSTMLNVLPDPRIPYNREAEIAKRALGDRLTKSIKQLTEAVDRLDEAKELTDKVLGQLKDVEGRDMRDLEKKTKAVQDTLRNKRDLIIARPMDKQGYGRPYRLTPLTKLQETTILLRTKPAVTTTETNLVEQTETLTKEVVATINDFFAKQWPEYRKAVEGTQVKLFKDYQPIR